MGKRLVDVSNTNAYDGQGVSVPMWNSTWHLRGTLLPVDIHTAMIGVISVPFSSGNRELRSRSLLRSGVPNSGILNGHGSFGLAFTCS